MKKNLLLSTALLIGALSANAQITITTADVAMPTKIIYQSNDTLPTVTPGVAGISQTWNMSALNTHTTDTLTFISASWVPNASFPTANLAMKQGWQNNYAYLDNSASGLSSLGFAGTADFGAGPFTIDQVNTPAEKLMNFPGMYLTSFTSNFLTTTPKIYLGFDPGIGFVIDTVQLHSGSSKTVTVDAWGSLTTPLGTFNVLRAKETVIKYDTTDICLLGLGGWNPIPGFTPQLAADSTTSYTFWANGVGFPLATVTMDSASNVNRVTWLQALPAVGVNEYTNATDVNVYPNPAQDQITFAVEASKVGAIQLFDVTGRMIDFIAVTGTTVSVNTSTYANGSYTYALVGKDNVILNRGKFTVVK